MCSFAEQSFPRRRANFRRCIRFDSLEEHDVNINFPVANFSIDNVFTGFRGTRNLNYFAFRIAWKEVLLELTLSGK